MKGLSRALLVTSLAFLSTSGATLAADDSIADGSGRPTYRFSGTATRRSPALQNDRSRTPAGTGVVFAPDAVSPGPSVYGETGPVPEAQSGCAICMVGVARGSWSGNTGSFQLDELINHRSSGTSGTLRLSLSATSTPPVFGDTISGYQQSTYDVLGALAAGSAFNNIDSGTIAYYNSSIPAGSYYQVMVAEELSGGTWKYTDFIVANKQMLCNGTSSCRTVSTGGATVLVPIVLDVYGANNSHYTTELTFTNMASSSLSVTLVYKAALGIGSGLVSLTLAAGQQLIVPDAIKYLRNQGLSIPNDGSNVGGALFVVPATSTDPSSWSVGARTFTPGPSGGTFGLYYPGQTLEQATTSLAYVTGLQQNSSQRSNLAVVNWGEAGDSITLSIAYFDGSGAALGTPTTVTLSPGQWTQFNTPLQGTGATSGYARIQQNTGSSSFVAYGVLNDAVSSDGSYIPMKF
jgi:hypothetical protein